MNYLRTQTVRSKTCLWNNQQLCNLFKRCIHRSTIQRKEKYKLQQRPPVDKTKDFIGPPDSVSNLRPIIYRTSENLSPLERQYHKRSETVMKWNQEFWSKHNKSFIKEKEAFIENKLKSKPQVDCKNTPQTLSPEEMSEFYKEFLDKNYTAHVKYNIEWYKKNISLLFPALRVTFYRFLQKFR